MMDASSLITTTALNIYITIQVWMWLPRYGTRSLLKTLIKIIFKPKLFPFLGCFRSIWESHLRFYVLRTYVGFYWSWELVVFYPPVCRGYIRKVSVNLAQKYFHMISVLVVFLAVNEKKEYDKNNIKTRQQQDRDETVLMLATKYQGKSTLRCCFQSIRPVAKPLPPPSLSLIPCTRCLPSVYASVVAVEVFVSIFLRQRLHCRCRLFGPVVDPLLPPL